MKFTDKENRLWSCDINMSVIRRVKNDTGKNLLTFIDQIEEVEKDPLLVIDLLVALYRDEFTRRGITEDEFVNAIEGDVFEQALNSLIDSLVEFLPENKKKVLAKAIGSLRKQQDRQLQELEKQLDKEILEQEKQESTGTNT